MTTETPNVAGEVIVETVTPVASTTQSKPYDDLEAYADEGTDITNEPTGDRDIAEAAVEPDSDSPKVEADEEAPKDEEIEPGERKGDKVEDNFDLVKITKEINGKEVEFTVGDAIKSHMERETFNRDMDRRSTALSKEKKAFEEFRKQDQAKLKSKVDEVFKNLRTQGGFISGVRALASLAAAGDPNFNVVDFEKMYFKQFDEAVKINQLPKEQQEAYWAKREAEEAKKQVEKLQTEKQTNEEKKQLSSTIAQACQQSGVENDEFWAAYKYLADHAVGEDKFFGSKEDIQIPNVINHVFLQRHDAKVREAGKQLGIDSENDLLQILKHTIHSEEPLSVSDIVDIVNQSGFLKKAPPETVENLNRKAAKSNQQFSQGNSTKKANGKVDGYDEESLDFLYRNQPKQYTRIVR